MKKIVYILTLLILSSLIGCKVTGIYSLGNGFSHIRMIIKEDSTFAYTTFFDAGGTDTIRGKWKLHKGYLILNSFAKPKFKPNSIYEKTEANKDKKLIIVQNMDVDASAAIISINNGQKVDTLRMLNDSNYWNDSYPMGLTGAYTHIDSIKNIRIIKTDNWTDCILKDSSFNTLNPKSNLIIIYSQPYNHYWGMKYFVDTKWKLRFNRIYPWRKTITQFDKKYFLTKKRNHIAHTGELP